jgi:hypothetical protein
VLAEQVYDNCLVAAGLLDDSRSMIPRINDILVCVVKGAQEKSGSVSPAKEAATGGTSTETTIDSDVVSGSIPEESTKAKDETIDAQNADGNTSK